MDQHYLRPLFRPQSIVAFTGAGSGSAPTTPQGRAIDAALRAQRFAGPLQFVDAHTSGTLAELAQARADLAVIALPADELAMALDVAIRMGCRSAVALSEGVAPAQAAALRKMAQRGNLQLLGPSGLGIQCPELALNASALGPLAQPGALALVSQSGALTASMLDWAAGNAVGFSSVISLGPDPAVDLADALDFLASDARSDSILVYMEGIADARRFMSALRCAAHAKPVVVLKAGRRDAGRATALTHSGAIVGTDEVFEAALRRAGAVRVRSFVELFSAAKCLASRYRPVGPRLAIVTNGGGPGVLAADRAGELDLEVAALSAERARVLAAQLPPFASLTALLDLTESATAHQYRAAVLAAGEDPGIDGVLAIHSPKPPADSDAIAAALADCRPAIGKPLLACWMGDRSVASGRQRLNEAGIPSFRTPEAAVGAFSNIASFYRNQRLLQQTPPPLSMLAKPDIDAARLIIESVLAERRRVLTEMESKTLLSSFHIPVTHTVVARSANEAMMIATQMGFPVALKIESPDVGHKTDVQGVALNLANGVAVRDTYTELIDRVRHAQPTARITGVAVQKMAAARRGREICIGVVSDQPFGPVITFGAGGTMIELLDDRAMELPPLNQFLARRLIERARVAETLVEWRGAPAVDFEVLEQVLLRVSEMVCELPQLREMDINPLIVDADGVVAVDARIVVDHAPAALPGQPNHYGHLAILPYPARHEQLWPTPDGGSYTIRPVHPDDAEMLQAFVRALSSESRYFRFVSAMTELPAAMLARFTLIDYDREMALVAVVAERSTVDGVEDTRERMIGVSRYVINPDQTSCEFSLVVADDQRGRGLGSRLMASIMEVARERGLQSIEGLVLRNNAAMLALMRTLGFEIRSYAEDPDFMLVSRTLQ